MGYRRPVMKREIRNEIIRPPRTQGSRKPTSENRNSTLFGGPGGAVATRKHTSRFSFPQAVNALANWPGWARMYEPTVGKVIAHMARACSRMPAINELQVAWIPYCALVSGKIFSPVSASASEMWMWQPVPTSWGKGLGAKVAKRPCLRATDLSSGTRVT